MNWNDVSDRYPGRDPDFHLIESEGGLFQVQTHPAGQVILSAALTVVDCPSVDDAKELAEALRSALDGAKTLTL